MRHLPILIWLTCFVSFLTKAQQNSSRDSTLRLLQQSDRYFLTRQDKSGLDSSILFAEKAEAISSRGNDRQGLGDSYMALSKALAKSGQREKGRDYVQRAIKLYSEADLQTGLGFAYWEMAGYFDYSAEQYPQKISLIQQSVAAFHRAGNTKKEADALKELADATQVNGNSAEALTELKQALNLYLSIHEVALQGIYDLLGSVSCDLGSFNQAVQYGLQAVQVAENLNDTTLQLCAIYNHVGMTYYYLRDWANSTAYYAKALAIAEKYKSYNDIYIISFNYGNNLVKLGKFQEADRHLSSILEKYPGIDTMQLIAYTSAFLHNNLGMKRLAQAEKYYDRLSALVKDRKLSVEMQNVVYNNQIKYLLQAGRNREAREMIERQEKYLAGNSFTIMMIDNLKSWIVLDSAVGDFKAAYRHFNRYSKLKDSMYDQERSRYISMLNVQYESAKKDQDLLLKEKDIELLKRNNQLQTAEMGRIRLVRNWSLAAGILLAIAVLLFVRIVQIKQRGNRKLQRQQEEIEKKNASLSQLVNEKEWLVREIHHRVKNNFHMVIALLGTQSRYLRTSEAIRAITDSQNRVYAMALVHQKLYQSDTLSCVMMSDYVRDLVHYFRESLGDARKVKFVTDVDPIQLSLAYCIPLGLAINEAITNSIKYAFPNAAEGTITISFKKMSNDTYVLKVADNGIGLGSGFATRKSDSMGMKLMNGLSDDLEARLTITGEEGTAITMVFNMETA